ncbi:putative MAGUK p55 subfamily member, partial [Daphnia magna]
KILDNKIGSTSAGVVTWTEFNSVDKLMPSESQRPSRENRVRVRALFDFMAALDRYIVSE